MDKNDCCILKYNIYRLQLGLLQHQDDNFATEHVEVVNSSTNNAQRVLQHVVVQQ